MVREEKIKEVEEIRSLIESYTVIGVLNMHKLPARQLGQIRHRLPDTKIKMSKKSFMVRALEGSKKKGIAQIKDNVEGPTAFLFTNENPFRLFRRLKESRTPATAKVGDIATKEIVIQKGSTGLPPGPAISTLQKIGLKSSVQGGKIAVLQDKVVCKAGETISEDLASVLSLLKIEPLEIGLELVAAYEDGIIYDRSVLDVSMDDYIKEIEAAVHCAFNLSINTGYPTKQTIELMIQKVFSEAKGLAVEADILEKDFMDEVLIKAIRQALALESKFGV
jgi:large subunit ribosomal protein L10